MNTADQEKKDERVHDFIEVLILYVKVFYGESPARISAMLFWRKNISQLQSELVLF
jgi:hypothetical protein